jgi:DNA-binding transcriptional regulator LsrR (DeoR family)
MARIDELRLMAKVAHMYHTLGLRQMQICEQLNIHQSTVSRVLKRAEREGIVRTSVSLPPGTHTGVEDQLQAKYELYEAVVVDSLQEEEQLARDLGAAAAFYLENTLKAGDVVGISSWSAALLAMVNAMHPTQRWKNTRVVQILGGIGSPNAEVHATQMTRRLAGLIGGEAILLPAPGIVGSKGARDVLMKDPFVLEAVNAFRDVTLALVGIGATEPSRALASSGNVFSPQELKSLASKGAVGDICLRFFNAAGQQVATELNDRVISIEPERLRAVRRVVGVAGGRRKWTAIRAALEGKLVNVLITDTASAEQLLSGKGAKIRGGAR